LLEYAKKAFEDLKSTDDGATLGAHRKQLEKTRGDVDEYDIPDLEEGFPEDLEGVWSLFQNISKGRSSTIVYLPAGMGASKPKLIHMNLSATEILSWATLMQVELEPWEIYVIRELDGLYTSAVNS